MRPTTTEATTGGVSPADLAAQQDHEFVAQGAVRAPIGRRDGVTTITTTIDPDFDPVGQRLVDPAATLHLAPPPEVITYNLPERGWWSQRSPEQVARRIARYPDAILDAVRADVVAAIGDAYKLWRRAVRAHAGDAERAAAEGYVHPSHDRAALHAQTVLKVVNAERETRQ